MEQDILRSILDYLTLTKVFHYRQNSGATRTASGGFIRFGITGAPDIVCVKNGQYIGLEVKDKKTKQSEGQIDFQKRLEEAGGKYFVVRSIDDVVEALKSC